MIPTPKILTALLTMLLTLLTATTAVAANNDWTWMSGSDLAIQPGVYGTQGVADPTNVPGARREVAGKWIDSSGNLWLLGGYGYDSAGRIGLLNDLWKYDGTNWTWVGGSNVRNRTGVYGTQGVAAASNWPGVRRGSISWTDSSGNLWLFGGNGWDSAYTSGFLNDLWKYDGTYWTWMGGSNLANQHGVYGTQGVAASTNVPGGRLEAISWADGSGNLWLFGGSGLASTGTSGELNDLWKYDGTYWTWMGGSNLTYQSGVYGTQGVAASTNWPGARSSAVSWTDSSDNLWLFGGIALDTASSTYVRHNDLWKFDGTNWTWMSGSDLADQSGVYGTQGTAASTNVPGARFGAVSWMDSGGNLWLFGGHGYDSTTTVRRLNDLWKFNGTDWTWVSGTDVGPQWGVYGTQGVAASTNVPGGREWAASWIDSSGKLWLFGGWGLDSVGTTQALNDLWRGQP